MPTQLPRGFWTKWVPAFGTLLVALYFAIFLYKHALNIPYHDDILDVLNFLTQLSQTTDLSYGIGLFFEGHNEHRTLASRIIYSLAFLFEGEANFRTLTFLGNLGIPLLLTMLYITVRRHEHAWLILLPAALVLLQLRTYGLYFFSMSAFAYFYVYFYGFAAIACLHNVNSRRFMAAAIFATLGTFTLASGQLIWIIGLLSLLHQRFILRRGSYAYPFAWLICTVLVLAIWRIDYETQRSMTVTLGNLADIPLHTLLFFLTLCGSAIVDNNVSLAVGAGAIMVCAFIYSALRNLSRDNITLELFVAYILITILSITLGRAAFGELPFALLSRYAFSSTLLLTTTIVMCLYRAPRSVRKPGTYFTVLVLAIGYWLYSFQIYSGALQWELEDRVSRYNKNQYWVIPYPIKETNAIVKESIALDIYHPPARPHPTPTVAPEAKRRIFGPLLRAIE
ncbi:MAG: hypothetical protein ACI9JM_002845 [Halioglobus sp.]|jgi:hypothetical protein